MVIDFTIKRAPGFTVASIKLVGPYSGRNMFRAEFNQLVKWAKKKKLRTGKWFMYELDSADSRRPANRRRWEACLEINGKAEPEGKIKIKRLPAQTVASVTFDPEKVSSRVIYHGLSDWLRWRLKFGQLKELGPTREVHTGNPWTDSRAWARTEVQVLVRE
jgi:DNA gyrase inhibitor GyrI